MGEFGSGPKPDFPPALVMLGPPTERRFKTGFAFRLRDGGDGCPKAGSASFRAVSRLQAGAPSLTRSPWR